MSLNGQRLTQVEDKVFLVTGGAAGVGAGIVRALLMDNARHVAFLDVADREGKLLETELMHNFGALKAKFIQCDIADDAQLADAFKQVYEKYRRLDVVINNAGVLSDDMNYKKIIDVNITATICSTIKAFDIMGAEQGGTGGTIVNISSQLALKRTPHLPVYASTKLAVLQFSNSIGADIYYSKSKVRVLTVCLGPTDTAILQKPVISHFDKDYAQCLTSRASVRQRVESAAKGIIQVIECGKSSSTWMVADDKPPVDISDKIAKGFDVMSLGINYNE